MVLALMNSQVLSQLVSNGTFNLNLNEGGIDNDEEKFNFYIIDCNISYAI